MGKEFTCVDCATKGCNGKGDPHPAFCLSQKIDPAIRDEVMARYDEDDNRRIMEVAGMVEHEFYGRYSRVQETVEFAHRMGCTRIGIATCAGLLAESRTLRKILEAAGFEVFGVTCKIDEQKKVDFGFDPETESTGVNICNPIMQARLLEEAGTQFNIVMGLCVGHDALFSKYSHTLTTTLVTKDRVTGHNPCAALYLADGFYRQRLNDQIEGYRE